MANTNDSNETILGMIECAGAHSKFYALFFTTSRIVMALTVGSLRLAIDTQFICERASKEKAKRLAAMTPDAILQADESNFFIPYAAITSITVKKGGFLSTTFIMIVADKKKHKFSFPKGEFDQCVTALKKVIPDKLTVQ